MSENMLPRIDGDATPGEHLSATEQQFYELSKLATTQALAESVAMDRPSVSVCFPAYNEEASISDVLEEADKLLSQSGLEYEILVCNDGSADRTGSIIDYLAGRISRLRIIHHPRNLGIRATFEHLYSEATKEFVFLNSTDRQWKTSTLLELLPLSGEWDVIVASRLDKRYGLLRRFISWAFNVVPSMLFGVRTFDAGAVKLTRREIIERFSLVSKSPFSEAERLIRADRAGYRITEYPVEISSRQSGRANGVNRGILLEACADIARVWWALHQEKAIAHRSKRLMKAREIAGDKDQKQDIAREAGRRSAGDSLVSHPATGQSGVSHDATVKLG